MFNYHQGLILCSKFVRFKIVVFYFQPNNLFLLVSVNGKQFMEFMAVVNLIRFCNHELVSVIINCLPFLSHSMNSKVEFLFLIVIIMICLLFLVEMLLIVSSLLCLSYFANHLFLFKLSQDQFETLNQHQRYLLQLFI